MKWQAWSAVETTFLREWYGYAPIDWLAEQLHRQPYAVYMRASRMGLTRPRQERTA
jgi:hypothetical protein